jgi:Uma2 family endonuclease
MSVEFPEDLDWTFRGIRPRFPVEVEPPPGFDPDDLATWPEVAGRFEYVEGRLLYMPPCGDLQSLTVVDVSGVIGIWRRAHPAFLVGSLEAGMALGKDKRGADVAVWLRSQVPVLTGGFLRVPPILAVEVSGRDEDEAALTKKARWYLKHDVKVVWLVLVEPREVLVVTRAGTSRHALGERLSEHPDLPDLAPLVDELFAQIEGP